MNTWQITSKGFRGRNSTDMSTGFSAKFRRCTAEREKSILVSASIRDRLHVYKLVEAIYEVPNGHTLIASCTTSVFTKLDLNGGPTPHPRDSPHY
jgi:hypothetical protein